MSSVAWVYPKGVDIDRGEKSGQESILGVEWLVRAARACSDEEFAAFEVAVFGERKSKRFPGACNGIDGCFAMSEVQMLQARIDEANAKAAALRAELDARRAVAREEYLIRLRADVSALGLSVEDVVAALGGRKAVAKTRKPRQARVLISNPNGPVYRGGAVPGWLHDAMYSAGYAPTDKAARQRFLAEHMRAA